MLASGPSDSPPPSFDDLSRAAATHLKHHRTGDVARVAADATSLRTALIRKRFWYPTARDLWRGALRTTWLARSRVEGEAENLERFAEWGVQPPLFLAFGERRRFGVLLDSFLCMRELAARPLDELLRDEREPARRRTLLDALGRLAGRLHARGFKDGDLHLRNVLASADGSLAKVDSPFGRVVARWRRAQASRRELARLCAELAPIATEAELSAFHTAYRAALTAPAAPSCRG